MVSKRRFFWRLPIATGISSSNSMLNQGGAMYKKILVCLDGSKLAEQVIPHAFDIALASKARLVLFRVAAVPVAVDPRAPVVPPQVMVEPEVEATVKDYLVALAAPLVEKGVGTEAVVHLGYSAGQEIVDYTNKNSIDLIALATHGRTGLGRAVFGSVADHVLRESGLPILLIRPK